MPDAPLDRALSVRELARRWAISPRKVRDFIRRRMVRAIDVGGSARRQLRILPEAIREFEERLAVAPPARRKKRICNIDPEIARLLD